MEVFVLSELYRFSVRTSGRDLSQVRRPKPSVSRAAALALKKPELQALAEEHGVETSGTKAEIVDRLTGESDD